MIFSVLFVCTGNVCRSPMAERLLQARLSERIPSALEEFRISSAGLVDLGGAAMEPNAMAALTALGVGCDGHRSHVLTPDHVADADLVLGMTREHRGAALALAPSASARIFTLRQFDRLCAGVDSAALPDEPPAGRAAAIVAAAHLQRGLVPAVAPEDDDITDPLARPAEEFTLTAGTIDAALGAFVTLLGGPEEARGD